MAKSPGVSKILKLKINLEDQSSNIAQFRKLPVGRHEGVGKPGLTAYTYLARQVTPPQEFLGLSVGKPHHSASNGIRSVRV